MKKKCRLGKQTRHRYARFVNEENGCRFENQRVCLELLEKGCWSLIQTNYSIHKTLALDVIQVLDSRNYSILLRKTLLLASMQPLPLFRTASRGLDSLAYIGSISEALSDTYSLLFVNDTEHTEYNKRCHKGGIHHFAL